jgi:hypothetical protein
MKDALRSANYHLERVPRLVPLHSNHYLPGGHGTSGHPVLSVYQTDVSCYAADLSDYPDPDPSRVSTPTVPFWSDLIVSS